MTRPLEVLSELIRIQLKLDDMITEAPELEPKPFDRQLMLQRINDIVFNAMVLRETLDPPEEGPRLIDYDDEEGFLEWIKSL